MVLMGGAVDEPNAWAGICSRFRELRGEAGQWGLGDRWRSLVDATRKREALIADWLALLAELAELRGAAEDFASRGGIRGDAAVSGYGCPESLCSRHAARPAFGETPRCELLRRDLVDLAEERGDVPP
jgi:hypothetical protein